MLFLLQYILNTFSAASTKFAYFLLVFCFSFLLVNFSSSFFLHLPLFFSFCPHFNFVRFFVAYLIQLCWCCHASVITFILSERYVCLRANDKIRALKVLLKIFDDFSTILLEFLLKQNLNANKRGLPDKKKLFCSWFYEKWYFAQHIIGCSSARHLIVLRTFSLTWERLDKMSWNFDRILAKARTLSQG